MVALRKPINFGSSKYVEASSELLPLIDPHLWHTINLIAKPGAGKGMFTNYLVHLVNARPYSSSSAITTYVEEEIRPIDTLRAEDILNRMKNCEYVPDEIVISAFKRELPRILEELNAGQVIVLDGLTRTQAQSQTIANLLQQRGREYPYNITTHLDISDALAEFRQLTRGLEQLYKQGASKVRLDTFDPNRRLREYNPNEKDLLLETKRHTQRLVYAQGAMHPEAVAFSILYQLANPGKNFDDARNTEAFATLAKQSVAPVELYDGLCKKIETERKIMLKDDRLTFTTYKLLREMTERRLEKFPELSRKPE